MQLTQHLAGLLIVGISSTANYKNRRSPSLRPSNINDDTTISLDILPPEPLLMMDSMNMDRRCACLAKIALVSSTLFTAPPPASAAPSRTLSKPIPQTALRSANFPQKQPGLAIGDPSKGLICEVFVDFACPYSRKTFATLSKLTTGGNNGEKYLSSMAFVFHNVIQPWHHQSLWLHESSFAVKLLYPTAELAYWTALFENAMRFYDKEVYSLTRSEFYDTIATFAANVVAKEATDGNGKDTDVASIRLRLLQYLVPPMQKGGDFPPEAAALLGSSPTDDENALFPLTRQTVKFQRRRGVHVTPTVFFNGIEQGQIESGWGVEEWKVFLDGALAV